MLWDVRAGTVPNIKNRQPIGQMYVKAPEALGDFYKDIIADELNVKNVTFTDDVSSYTDYQFKPQLRTVSEIWKIFKTDSVCPVRT